MEGWWGGVGFRFGLRVILMPFVEVLYFLFLYFFFGGWVEREGSFSFLFRMAFFLFCESGIYIIPRDGWMGQCIMCGRSTSTIFTSCAARIMDRCFINFSGMVQYTIVPQMFRWVQCRWFIHQYCTSTCSMYYARILL